jgi:alpha-glucosidase
VLDGYGPGDRMLVAEAWVDPPERLARYVRPDEMHQAFNFAFLATGWNAPALREIIAASYQVNDSVGAPTTWVLSNHDVVRHPSRLGLPTPGDRPNGIGRTDPQPDEELGLRRGRAASLLLLGLPGSAYLYQGEELGLPEHTSLDDELREDPAFFRTNGAERGRDGCRVPLPWEADAPAMGYSPTGLTWLPQPEEWKAYAADVQTGQDGSTLELYRETLRLRRELGLGLGGMVWAEEYAGTDQVIAFRNRDVLVVANLGSAPVPLPAGAQVLLSSGLTGDAAPGDELPGDTTAWLRVG